MVNHTFHQGHCHWIGHTSHNDENAKFLKEIKLIKETIIIFLIHLLRRWIWGTLSTPRVLLFYFLLAWHHFLQVKRNAFLLFICSHPCSPVLRPSGDQVISLLPHNHDIKFISTEKPACNIIWLAFYQSVAPTHRTMWLNNFKTKSPCVSLVSGALGVAECTRRPRNYSSLHEGPLRLTAVGTAPLLQNMLLLSKKVIKIGHCPRQRDCFQSLLPSATHPTSCSRESQGDSTGLWQNSSKLGQSTPSRRSPWFSSAFISHIIALKALLTRHPWKGSWCPEEV